MQNLDVVFSTILLVSNLNDSYYFSSRRLSDRTLSRYLSFWTVWTQLGSWMCRFVCSSFRLWMKFTYRFCVCVHNMNVLYKRCKLVNGELTIIVIPFTFSNSIQSNRLYVKHNNDVNIYLEDTQCREWNQNWNRMVLRMVWSLSIDQSGSNISFDVKVQFYLFWIVY